MDGDHNVQPRDEHGRDERIRRALAHPLSSRLARPSERDRSRVGGALVRRRRALRATRRRDADAAAAAAANPQSEYPLERSAPARRPTCL
jgi:hypothetical protein